VNKELHKINEWFMCNRLSLNVKKTKYILFHKSNKNEDIPLKLPSLKINNTNIKRETFINFLGVVIDENLSWKLHINTLEKKLSRNICLMYKAKPFLNIMALKSLYFSLIHSHLSYGNMAWGSTNYTKLKKLYSKQKHACRIVFGVNKKVSCEPFLCKLGALSVYKINIHLVLQFMYKIKYGLSPVTFQSYFSEISHKYPTRFSHNNFVIPKFTLKQSSYSVEHRGPYLWKFFPKIITNKKNTLEQFKFESKRFLLSSDLNFLFLF
jgi:hypothetical protein